jgi:hypothetical protein
MTARKPDPVDPVHVAAWNLVAYFDADADTDGRLEADRPNLAQHVHNLRRALNPRTEEAS